MLYKVLLTCVILLTLILSTSGRSGRHKRTRSHAGGGRSGYTPQRQAQANNYKSTPRPSPRPPYKPPPKPANQYKPPQQTQPNNYKPPQKPQPSASNNYKPPQKPAPKPPVNKYKPPQKPVTRAPNNYKPRGGGGGSSRGRSSGSSKGKGSGNDKSGSSAGRRTGYKPVTPQRPTNQYKSVGRGGGSSRGRSSGSYRGRGSRNDKSGSSVGRGGGGRRGGYGSVSRRSRYGRNGGKQGMRNPVKGRRAKPIRPRGIFTKISCEKKKDCAWSSCGNKPDCRRNPNAAYGAGKVCWFESYDPFGTCCQYRGKMGECDAGYTCDTFGDTSTSTESSTSSTSTTAAPETTATPESVDCSNYSFDMECGESRHRKPWQMLTECEKQRYAEGFYALYEKRDSSGMRLTHAFAKQHGEKRASYQAHGTSAFLPWHRAFLWEFETQIRNLGGKFTCFALPLWDWTHETFNDNQENDAYEILSSTLGGAGDIDDNDCVNDGSLFSKENYKPFTYDCLKRTPYSLISQTPVSVQQMAKILTRRIYGNDADDGGRGAGFRYLMESEPHGFAHVLLGGPNGHLSDTETASDDPIFWLIHAFVDYMWALWQDCHDYDEIDRLALHNIPNVYDGGPSQQYGSITYGPSGLNDALIFDTINNRNFYVGTRNPKFNRKRLTPQDMHDITDWGVSYEPGDFYDRGNIYKWCSDKLKKEWFYQEDIDDNTYSTPRRLSNYAPPPPPPDYKQPETPKPTETRSNTVTAVNDEAGPIPQGSPGISIDVLSNDQDKEGDQFRIVRVTQPSGGMVSINRGSRTVQYIPKANFCGKDSFTYTIRDDYTPNSAQDTGKVTVIVTCAPPQYKQTPPPPPPEYKTPPPADYKQPPPPPPEYKQPQIQPPVANDDQAVTEEDIPVVIDVLSNDSGNPDKISKYTQPSKGTVTGPDSNGKLTYTPNTGTCGADKFTYTISKSTANGDLTSTATVSVAVSCAPPAKYVVPPKPTTTAPPQAEYKQPEPDPYKRPESVPGNAYKPKQRGARQPSERAPESRYYTTPRDPKYVSDNSCVNNGGNELYSKQTLTMLEYREQQKPNNAYATEEERTIEILSEWSRITCEFNKFGLLEPCERPQYFDDCSNMKIDPYTGDIKISLDQMLFKVRSSPCMMEKRKMFYKWAKKTRKLLPLCNGAFDGFCGDEWKERDNDIDNACSTEDDGCRCHFDLPNDQYQFPKNVQLPPPRQKYRREGYKTRPKSYGAGGRQRGARSSSNSGRYGRGRSRSNSRSRSGSNRRGNGGGYRRSSSSNARGRGGGGGRSGTYRSNGGGGGGGGSGGYKPPQRRPTNKYAASVVYDNNNNDNNIGIYKDIEGGMSNLQFLLMNVAISAISCLLVIACCITAYYGFLKYSKKINKQNYKFDAVDMNEEEEEEDEDEEENQDEQEEEENVIDH